LKKRSKKLLIHVGVGIGSAKTAVNQSFFASFCSQKEVLTFFPCRQ
jgi:hypothetical protein